LGEESMSKGVTPALVVESDKSILVRVKIHYYQSIMLPGVEFKEELDHSYGLIVLPRRPNKPVVLAYNEQCYIGGPEFWKEKDRLTLESNPNVKTNKER